MIVEFENGATFHSTIVFSTLSQRNDVTIIKREAIGWIDTATGNMEKKKMRLDVLRKNERKLTSKILYLSRNYREKGTIYHRLKLLVEKTGPFKVQLLRRTNQKAIS